MENNNDEPRAKPRLSVDITEKEQDRMRELIPWGLQSAIVRTLMNSALDLIEEYGEVALAGLITGKVSALDIIRRIDKEVKSGSN
uniref:Uncharacterized protein n=1 Tax=viral metagenome TaxID=1070528 RepID=A0A6M3LUU3_9ZZZZ